MKTLLILVVLLLSFFKAISFNVNDTNKISITKDIVTNWVLMADWTLTNPQCNGCPSIWYSIWRSSYPINGYYTYIIYFQSASLFNNGVSARTEYNNLIFYYDNVSFHNNKWGIIGNSKDTQQSFQLYLPDSNPGNRFRFTFGDIKIN